MYPTETKFTSRKHHVQRTESYQYHPEHKWEEFSVVFTKKDGTERKMNCRTEVKKYLKGGHNPNPKLGKTMLVVFDVISKGYRTINLETLKEIKSQRKVYKL